MNVHVSYQFQTAEGHSGFGDATILGVPRRIVDGADIESLRRRIKEELSHDGHSTAKVVIISWRELCP